MPTHGLAMKFTITDLETLRADMSYVCDTNYHVQLFEKSAISSGTSDCYYDFLLRIGLMTDLNDVLSTSPDWDYLNEEIELKPEAYSSDNLTPEDTDTSGDDTYLRKQAFYPYTVQVCSVKLKERAIIIAKTSRKMGDFAFTSPAYLPEKGDWYRIFVGYYGTSEEARKAAFALKKKKYPHAFVTKMPFAIQINIPLYEDIKKIKAALESNGCLAYSVSDRICDENTELLIGAFKIKKDAVRLMERLQEENFKTRLVLR